MSMPARIETTRPTLTELLAGFADAPPLAVHDLASDSRRLTAGAVFLACRGARSHALQHLDAAQAASLAAVVWDADPDVAPPDGVTAIAVPGLARHLGEIANRYFGEPSKAVRVSGVTGTNGKTTVAWLLAQCRERLGQRCAYVGTLGAGIDEVVESVGLTTPDCVELHRLLAEFRGAGARHAAIEVSSHGLAQGRVDGVAFDTALFTNLSRDHIDYHGSMENYFENKARLFTQFAPRRRIVCIDSEHGRQLASRCGADAVRVASQPGADRGDGHYLFATSVEPLESGAVLELDSSWGQGRAQLSLVGGFNVANALTVLAALLVDGVDFADGLDLLSGLQAPPGRLQRVDAGPATGAPQVFVDYAHTPAALEAALAALRPHCRAALWCVFGCGGERDRGKRPDMGRVVAAAADRPLLTSDNPRGEDPADIIRDVQAGVADELPVIEDRAAAIAYAIGHAGPDDVVLIAGKGHENYQLVGTRKLPFSDYLVASEHLRARS